MYCLEELPIEPCHSSNNGKRGGLGEAWWVDDWCFVFASDVDRIIVDRSVVDGGVV